MRLLFTITIVFTFIACSTKYNHREQLNLKGDVKSIVCKERAYYNFVDSYEDMVSIAETSSTHQWGIVDFSKDGKFHSSDTTLLNFDFCRDRWSGEKETLLPVFAIKYDEYGNWIKYYRCSYRKDYGKIWFNYLDERIITYY